MSRQNDNIMYISTYVLYFKSDFQLITSKIISPLHKINYGSIIKYIHLFCFTKDTNMHSYMVKVI